MFALDAEQIASDKWAWRSLWLGLSSILLLCFTGLPALYFGVRSLLRMRHTKAKKSDRAAAVAGTTFGAIFGVVGGSCLVTSAVLALVFWLTLEIARGEQQTRSMLTKIGEIDVPNQLIPERGVRLLNSQTRIIFRDREKSNGAIAAARLIHFAPSLQASFSAMLSELHGTDLGSEVKGQWQSRRTLSWQMAGQPVIVSKDIGQLDGHADADAQVANTDVSHREIHRYVGHFRSRLGIFGLAVVVKQPDSGISEAEIQAFFESFRPLDPKKIKAAQD